MSHMPHIANMGRTHIRCMSHVSLCEHTCADLPLAPHAPSAWLSERTDACPHLDGDLPHGALSAQVRSSDDVTLGVQVPYDLADGAETTCKVPSHTSPSEPLATSCFGVTWHVRTRDKYSTYD